MDNLVKIEITTRETIKPSSPTPQNLRHMKLSLLDQLNFATSTPILLFYPLKIDKNDNNILHSIEKQSQKLKSSLSKALTFFYPLAGQVKNNSFIECNDYGVEYIEAQVNCSIEELFQNPDTNVLENLIPIDLTPKEKLFSGAIIHVNFFTCGGLAIGISLSHKIADAASLGIFLMAWANISSLSIETLPEAILPHFVSNTIIPSWEDFQILPSPPVLPIHTITRRYTISPSKIDVLKTNSASFTIQNPTRVEAVTALIWKCLITLSREKSNEVPKQSVLVQAVNLRKKLVPQLPQNYIGNLSGKFFAMTKKEDVELKDLVSYLREGIEKVSHNARKGVEGILEFAKEFGDLHSRDDVDFYSFSSLCGFPLYDIDFGWGKPMWTIVTNLLLKNYVVMIDTRDGKGVEIWMSLSQEDVPFFEANQEFLAFASINPSVPFHDFEVPLDLESCF